MKKLLMSLVAITSVVWFVGCSKNDGGSGGVSNCPVGSSWNGTYCVNSNGTIVNPTPTAKNYGDYSFYFSFEQGLYRPDLRGNLQIYDAAAYKVFLKEAMKVCDLSTWNWGGAGCDSWVQGSLQVSFSIDSSLKPTVDFRAVPAQTYWSGNLGFFTGGATLNPLQLYSNTTFSLINNSKGFEIRSNGSSWNAGGLGLIQIQVANGTLNDSQFTYKLFYKNATTPFATGTFKSY
ncbi:hypothetical protein [Bdellovibrio svalbardensis]|uniref:Lipoprotein n=1 Tax=Bdellovibrio svalbardensis TaxID=2972972 RepID=A0ABT6DEX3_9BACT|nr:hypothetical protein [Bdellovibrio svalbardensis]MDG0815376.1 hypothetical protein [Bdellovibrio svalbardensis]